MTERTSAGSRRRLWIGWAAANRGHLNLLSARFGAGIHSPQNLNLRDPISGPNALDGLGYGTRSIDK